MECVSWSGESLVVLGPAFDGAGFGSVGSVGDEVAAQMLQEQSVGCGGVGVGHRSGGEGAQALKGAGEADALAESDPAAPDANMLREAYRDGTDSHPTQTANEAVGSTFAEAVMAAARSNSQ